jgi:peroxiredoxin
MRHLRDRGPDLEKAGIRPYAVSLDQPWSQRAWAESLNVDTITFVSDRLGEAASGFGVMTDYQGVPMTSRTVFLVREGTIRASWSLDQPLPDIDAIIEAAAAP